MAKTAPATATEDEIDEMLNKYDKNGDGRFNREEVRRILFDVRGSQRRNKMLKKFVFLLFVIIIAALAAMFGVVMSANEISKESKVPKGGTEMRTLDGAVVSTAAAESVATLWDLPALDAAQLGHLKTMRVFVDMTSAPSGGWVDASFKLSSAYKPLGSATHATVLTYEGYTITIDGAGKSGQIVMGNDVYPVADVAPASARRLDEESFIPAPMVYSPSEWAALREKDTMKDPTEARKNGRALRGAASLSTTSSFTLSAGGSTDK